MVTAGGDQTDRDLAALIARAKSRQRSAVVQYEHVGSELNLTPFQHALWLHGQRHDDVTGGVSRWIARLDGDIDVARLAGALRAALRVRPALRSVIRDTERGPRRIILAQVPDVVVLKASGEELDVALQDALSLVDQRNRSISAAGPVAAVTIVRVDEQTTVLSLSVHHLFFDGASLRLVLDDVAQWYDAGSDSSDLVPLAESTRTPIVAARTDDDRAFWASVLSGAREPAQLVSWSAAPAAVKERTLSEEVSAALRLTAARAGVSMFTLVATAQALACRRLGAGDDVILVTPVDVRTVEQADEVGYFVNTMPIRVTMGDEVTVRELLLRVGDSVARALDARRLPVHEIVGIWREESGHVLLDPFSTLVDVVPGGSHNLGIAGIEVVPLPDNNVDVDFPLEVTLIDECCARISASNRAGVLGPGGLDVVLDSVVDSLLEIVHHLDERIADPEPRVPAFTFATTGDKTGETTPGEACLEETLDEVRFAFATALQLAKPPAPDDSFFDLGGHSLGAMRLGIEVRRRLHAKITVRDVFEHPTARSIAVLVEARGPVS